MRNRDALRKKLTKTEIIKMENKNKLSAYSDTLWLLIGEAIVALAVAVVYVALGRFDYTVITGGALGAFITALNFFILSVGVNRAVNRYIEARGNEELDDEAAEKFAEDHKMDVQNAMMKSYIFRILLMLGSLALALWSGYFNVIATAIPLLAYRPVMYAVEFIKIKLGKAGG